MWLVNNFDLYDWWRNLFYFRKCDWPIVFRRDARKHKSVWLVEIFCCCEIDLIGRKINLLMKLFDWPIVFLCAAHAKRLFLLVLIGRKIINISRRLIGRNSFRRFSRSKRAKLISCTWFLVRRSFFGTVSIWPKIENCWVQSLEVDFGATNGIWKHFFMLWWYQDKWKGFEWISLIN